MPNKFITNLDLARQAEIFSGETAVFQGGIQLGIPFSGFPSGVDTSTITSIGVVDTQFAAFSGNTGTTVFNVTDPASPYYNATATTLSVSPYTVIDNDTITETVSATDYPTIMTFTALSGTSDAPLSISFTPPVIQELYDRGLYGTLFDGLGLTFLGQTYSDESFYNDGSIFSGANLNMEIVEYAPHGATPAWVTGTTSGTVIEYSALTQYWTDPTIINGVSGLTLPITPESAETKTIDYVWTLTDSTIIDENVVGLKYTGYSVTYSFNDVIVDPESPSAVGATGATSADTYYLGTVTASLENFSAGTLDYKGSTNWISIDGNATVTERLTVDRLTINNPGTGSPINNIGITADGDVVFGTTGATVTGLTFNDFTYDLTVGLDNGLSFTDNLGILASDIKVTGGTFDDVAGEIEFVNNSGGTFVVSGLTTEFTGNTSGTCITDLHITNLHSCSPLYVNPLDEGNVYFGSTSGVTIDVANNRIGIGTETPSTQLHIAGSGGGTVLKVQSEDQNNAVVTLDSQTTGGAGPRNSLVQFQQNSTTEWMIGMNGVAGGSEEDKQLVIANGNSFDTDNVVNINPSNGYVGIGVQAPTERLDVGGDIKISGTNANITTELSTTGVNTLTLSGVSSQLSELKVTSTNSEFLSFGTRGSTEASFPTYGKNGDNYIYSSTNANGLNIISRDGIGTDDYIKFYAGQDASGSADVSIIGSGATKGYVGIGTETPSQKLDVSGNVKISGELNISTLGTGTSVNNLGIDGSGNIVSGTTGNTTYWTSGSGGTFSIKAINDSGIEATGDYSVAEGENTTASGIGSHAEGNLTIASGDYSHAEGFGGKGAIVASGLGSHAEGWATTATTDASHAEGISTIASGGASHAEGISTTASGGSSHAEGENTTASGLASHAEGISTSAIGNYSHSGGFSSTASGSTSFIHSYNSSTIGDKSAILGGNDSIIETGSTSSSIIGGNNNTIDDISRSTIIGGSGNTLTWGYTLSPSSNGGNNSIISSTNSILSGLSINSVILGGNNNKIYDPFGTIITQGINSAIIAGSGNYMNAVTNSVIIGGRLNSMDLTTLDTIIIGGSGNTINGTDRSVIIGGQGITATADDTVYTPDLIVSGNSIVYDSIGVGPNVTNPPGYDIDVTNNYDGATRVVVTNKNNSNNSVARFSVVGVDISGNTGSGSIAYYGGNFVPSGSFQGAFIPESLTIATGGGATEERAHINIGSRRADGEVRIFTGSDDFNASSIRLNVGTGSTRVYDDLIVDGGITTSGIPSYADDAAAGVGGLSTGEVYQTTGAGAAPLNVAGILMVKQ